MLETYQFLSPGRNRWYSLSNTCAQEVDQQETSTTSGSKWEIRTKTMNWRVRGVGEVGCGNLLSPPPPEGPALFYDLGNCITGLGVSKSVILKHQNTNQ